MTTLLKKAIKKAESLPEDKQDMVAAAMLEEIDADKRWDELFAKTTRKQWQAMVDKAQKSVEENGAISSEEFYSRTGETGSSR
jgi:L-rhamnose mutarotase